MLHTYVRIYTYVRKFDVMDNVENFWELNTPEMHLLFWRSVLWVNDLTNQPVGHSHHTNQQDTVHKLQQEN